MWLRFPLAVPGGESVPGVAIGPAPCMLLHRPMPGGGLRDTMFLDQAVPVAADVLTLSCFGIGALYPGPEHPAVSLEVAPMAVMVAVAAGTRCMAAALAVPELNPFIARWLR